jgi:hypothetical protein
MHLSGNIDRTDNSKNRIIKRHEWGIIFHDTLLIRPCTLGCRIHAAYGQGKRYPIHPSLCVKKLTGQQ